MRIRSGADYVASLRDHRTVWLDGEKVEDIAGHPSLKATVGAFARYYDLMNDPKNDDLLQFESPLTGEKASIFLQPPRSREELAKRGRALEFVMREFGGLLTRLPDYDQGIMVGLLAVQDEFGVEDKAFPSNIESWYARMLRENLMSVTAFNDPQVDRGKGLGDQGALRVVEKRSDGVLVRGARTLTTNAPFANDLVCLRKPVGPDGSDFCIDCIIPVDADGIQMICRPSLRGGETSKTELTGAPFDELDAIVVFDDVLIPKENVFMLGRPDIISKTWGTVTGWSPYHDLLRSVVKAELLLGVTSLIVDYIGTSKFPAVGEDLTEMIEYVETLRTFARASEAQAFVTPRGLVAPNKQVLDIAKFYHHRFYPRMISLMHNLSGQSLVSSPTEPYFEREELLPYLEKYFGGSNVSAKEKAKLFRLGWRIACDGFGGRQIMYELFNAATERTLRERLIKSYDRSSFVAMAKKVAGIAN